LPGPGKGDRLAGDCAAPDGATVTTEGLHAALRIGSGGELLGAVLALYLVRGDAPVQR